MRRFFSSVLPSNQQSVQLERETSHHLLRVVGIAPNEEVELFDGRGQGCVASLIGVQDGLAEVSWIRALPVYIEPPQLTLVLALTKGEAFSTAIRMATEIGVSRIVPLQAQRSIPKGDKQARWQKIATGAAGQSKRLSIPIVDPLQSWTTLWDVLPPEDARWILHPAVTGVLSVSPIVRSTTIFIGPEGGFTEQEVAWMLASRGEHRSLGNLVLKADTAAIVACAHCLMGF